MSVLILALTFMLSSNPAWDASAEQAAILVAESITWDCTTDGECFAACLAQGMPEPLCSDWSYNSAGYEDQPSD